VRHVSNFFSGGGRCFVGGCLDGVGCCGEHCGGVGG